MLKALERWLEAQLLLAIFGLGLAPVVILYEFTGSWIAPTVYGVVFAVWLIGRLLKRPPPSLSLTERQRENERRET